MTSLQSGPHLSSYLLGGLLLRLFGFLRSGEFTCPSWVAIRCVHRMSQWTLGSLPHDCQSAYGAPKPTLLVWVSPFTWDERPMQSVPWQLYWLIWWSEVHLMGHCSCSWMAPPWRSIGWWQWCVVPSSLEGLTYPPGICDRSQFSDRGWNSSCPSGHGGLPLTDTRAVEILRLLLLYSYPSWVACLVISKTDQPTLCVLTYSAFLFIHCMSLVASCYSHLVLCSFVPYLAIMS